MAGRLGITKFCQKPGSIGCRNKICHSKDTCIKHEIHDNDEGTS